MSDRHLHWPLPGHTAITSPFGVRVHPVTGRRSFHSGVDVRCPQDSQVIAPCDCRVLRVWSDEVHGGGLSMRIGVSDLQIGFCHLWAVLAVEGERVGQGQAIALTGGMPGTRGAGRSTGPHLHLTVRQGGRRIDPLSVPWCHEEVTP